MRLHLIPSHVFFSINDAVFGRRAVLYPGRLVCTLALTVTIYAMLRRWWRLVEHTVAWLLVPLGQASLVVFVTHIYVLIALANLPGVRPGHWPLNTLVQTAIILLMWIVARAWLARSPANPGAAAPR